MTFIVESNNNYNEKLLCEKVQYNTVLDKMIRSRVHFFTASRQLRHI